MPNVEENTITEETVKQANSEKESSQPETTEEKEEAVEADVPEIDNKEEGSEAETEVEADSDEEVEDKKDDEEESVDKCDDSSDDEKEEKKERKLFKKKDKKDKKDEKIEELTDKLTRQMAEFDNYRKRTEKEKAANYMIGARDVVEKILPVVDNFERGLADADLSNPFAEGMDKIYKQLQVLLTDLGVTPIEALGKEFDPNMHNAVMHIEDDELGENVIAEEFQKGYMFKGQVLRHSMVKVAN